MMPPELSTKHEIYFNLLLVFVITSIYAGSANAPLLSIDDATHFLVPQFNQPLSWTGLITIFTPGSHVDYYPIRDLSYWLDHQIWGSQWAGWRLQQILLLSAIAIGFHRILRSLKVDPWIAMLFTAAWALNPSHVEMVLWLTARKDLWMMFLGCASIWAFIQAIQRKSNLFFVLSTALYLLANLSKAGLVLLPLAGWLAWGLGFLRNVQRKSAYHLCLATSIALSFGLYGQWYYSTIYVQTYPIDRFTRFTTALTALAREVSGWFNPNVNIIDLMTWGEWLEFNHPWTKGGYALGTMFLAGLVYAVYRRNRHLLLFLGTGLFVYVPSSGIVFGNRNLYSIRYAEPLFFACMAFSAYYLASKKKTFRANHIPRLISWAFMVVVIALSVLATSNEARLWANPIQYLEKGVEQQPDSIRLRLASLQQIQSRFALEEISPHQQNIQASAMAEAIDRICATSSKMESKATCDLFWRRPPLSKDEFSEKYPRSTLIYENWIPPRRFAYQLFIESMKTGNNTQASAQTLLDHMPKNWQTTSDERIYHWAAQCLAGADITAKNFIKEAIARHLVDVDRIESFRSIASESSFQRLGACL